MNIDRDYKIPAEPFKFEKSTQRIIGCFYKVYNHLGTGFLEKVYENALSIELNGSDFGVFQQYPIQVTYFGN